MFQYAWGKCTIFMSVTATTWWIYMIRFLIVIVCPIANIWDLLFLTENSREHTFWELLWQDFRLLSSHLTHQSSRWACFNQYAYNWYWLYSLHDTFSQTGREGHWKMLVLHVPQFCEIWTAGLNSAIQLRKVITEDLCKCSNQHSACWLRCIFVSLQIWRYSDDMFGSYMGAYMI